MAKIKNITGIIRVTYDRGNGCEMQEERFNGVTLQELRNAWKRCENRLRGG